MECAKLAACCLPQAGHYFGIEVRHARCTFPEQAVSPSRATRGRRISLRNLRETLAGTLLPQAVDVAHVRSLIDSNTVALVGSAPQFATGTIDPIEARPPNLAPAVARPPSVISLYLGESH